VVTLRRGGRRVAPLSDLWVASGIPVDLLDATFEIVADDARGATVRSRPIDGVALLRAFVELSSHRLWWDGPREGLLHGLVVRSIETRRSRPAGRTPPVSGTFGSAARSA
jgi:hypothetical protein